MIIIIIECNSQCCNIMYSPVVSHTDNLVIQLTCDGRNPKLWAMNYTYIRFPIEVLILISVILTFTRAVLQKHNK